MQEEKSPVIAKKSLCGTDGNPHLDNSGQSYKILESILENSGQQRMEGCCLIVALSPARLIPLQLVQHGFIVAKLYLPLISCKHEFFTLIQLIPLHPPPFLSRSSVSLRCCSNVQQLHNGRNVMRNSRHISPF